MSKNTYKLIGVFILIIVGVIFSKYYLHTGFFDKSLELESETSQMDLPEDTMQNIEVSTSTIQKSEPINKAEEITNKEEEKSNTVSNNKPIIEKDATDSEDSDKYRIDLDKKEMEISLLQLVDSDSFKEQMLENRESFSGCAMSDDFDRLKEKCLPRIFLIFAVNEYCPDQDNNQKLKECIPMAVDFLEKLISQYNERPKYSAKEIVRFIDDLAMDLGIEGITSGFKESTIVPGVYVFNEFAGRITVGELFEATIRIISKDPRNPIVGLQITNMTPKGSVPSIVLGERDHLVTWTPNEADFLTSSLKITAKMQNGSTDTIETPVRVTGSRLVEIIPLKGPGRYSDHEGRYLVNITGATPNSDVSGTLTITEKYDYDGNYSSSYVLSDPGNELEVLSQPMGLSFPL